MAVSDIFLVMPKSDAWQGWPHTINASEHLVQFMAAYVLVLPPVSEWQLESSGLFCKNLKYLP